MTSADAVLRLYELKLGDMVYIYTLAERTDWRLLEHQARKHGWQRSSHKAPDDSR